MGIDQSNFDPLDMTNIIKLETSHSDWSFTPQVNGVNSSSKFHIVIFDGTLIHLHSLIKSRKS